MADWYPGAWAIPQGGNGNAITARPASNVFHIAASNWNIDVTDPTNGSKGIAGWNSGTRSCNGYNDQFGNMQQYCSVWSAVNGTKNGNYRNRTWESWDPRGLTGTNAQYNSDLYTPEQCERYADFLAWDHRNNGTLLQDMETSRPGTTGVGAHRYGVDSAGAFDRVSGGELWTASAGKVCPGTARVLQIKNQIIPRAIQLANWSGFTPLPKGRVDLKVALARANGEVPPTNGNEDWIMASGDDILAELKEIHRVYSTYSEQNIMPTLASIQSQNQKIIELLGALVSNTTPKA